MIDFASGSVHENVNINILESFRHKTCRQMRPYANGRFMIKSGNEFNIDERWIMDSFQIRRCEIDR